MGLANVFGSGQLTGTIREHATNKDTASVLFQLAGHTLDDGTELGSSGSLEFVRNQVLDYSSFAGVHLIADGEGTQTSSQLDPSRLSKNSRLLGAEKTKCREIDNST